jgi:anti-anti-sigma factor
VELTITRDSVESGRGALKLVGSIDLVTRKQVIDAGMDVLRDGDGLTLDLGGVEFMDSVGIGALIELSRAAENLGQRFVVSERSRRVSRVLEATGLSGVWDAS